MPLLQGQVEMSSQESHTCQAQQRPTGSIPQAGTRDSAGDPGWGAREETRSPFSFFFFRKSEFIST